MSKKSKDKKLYYFDNAATTWPKPERVYQAAESSLRNAYGNPGRTGVTQTLEAERLVYSAREQVAGFLNAEDPSRIVFTMNTTDALNMAIKGMLKPGDHVIYTAMEHNSVLRPLGGLKRAGIITTSMISCSAEGCPDLSQLEASINKNTKLIICNHASNVTGTILPVREVVAIARSKGGQVLVDAAQTGGVIPIDIKELGADMIAFAGHKGLLGPPGTGILYVREGLELDCWREGGTGSFSEQDLHPENMPERLEGGTMNSTGISALEEGIKFIQDTGLESIRKHEITLRRILWDKLTDIPGIKLYGPSDINCSTGIVSFTAGGIDCGEMGYILENYYNILCRTGLHCAPFAHRAIGSFPAGTVRLSPGFFTTEEDVLYVAEAIKEVCALKVAVH